MKQDRIVPGTARMQRYPSHGPLSKSMGIDHYGRTNNGYGRIVYKVSLSQLDRLEQIGYHAAKLGTSYAYVYK